MPFPQQIESVSLEQERLKVLVVEDSTEDFDLLKFSFEESAADTGDLTPSFQWAKDLDQVIEVLFAEATDSWSVPDLIILDLNLPKQNGHEILKTLKDDYTLKRIPVIVLSTSASEEDVQKSYALQASMHMQKPFELDEFKSLASKLYSFLRFNVRMQKFSEQGGLYE